MLFLQPHFFLDSGTVYAHVHDVRIEMDRGLRFEAVPCPACGGAMRDFFSPPAQLILKKGLLPDALYFNDLYVSEKFRAAWENEGLTGIEAFAPVEAVRRLGKKETIDEKYYLVVPAVSGAQLDILGSGCISGSAVIHDPDAYRRDLFQRSTVCENCGRVRLRMHSGKTWEPAWKHPEKWLFRREANLDLFTLENAFNTCGPTYILSDRFIAFVKKHRLTNIYGLTEEELYSAQGNRSVWNGFTPVYSNPESESLPSAKLKKEWCETSRAELQCNSGRFIVRDVLDDDEAFGLEIRVRTGKWRIWLAEDAPSLSGGQYLMLQHVDSDSAPSEKLGAIGLDSGAFYLRSCGADRRSENRIKDRLAEMGQSPALESVKRMAVSCRRGIAAAFLCTQAGDGDYEIHVDNIKEAGSIKIGPL